MSNQRKQELRYLYREKRQALSLQEMHARTAMMLETFREVPVIGRSTVMSFKQMVSKKEVPIQYFEEEAADHFGIGRFCYPAAYIKTGLMSAFLDDENLIWEEVGFGLTQPKAGTIVDPTAIDVVFVPLLAFDGEGNRLGYGKGFYDRFLQTCRPDAQKIGFSWFDAETLLPEISRQDVPLNYCVTPNRLYVF